MRLFVNKSDHKTYIAAYARTRYELAQNLGDQLSVKIEDTWYEYDILEVYAEPIGNFGPTFMIIGALIGMLGGPIGVILCGLAGGVIGRIEDLHEEDKAKIFNESGFCIKSPTPL